MITRDKNFYRLILSIAIPIAFQNLITFAVSMADSIMIGRLGELELAAVNLANQLFFVFMILTFGLGSGANILISQYWGKGDTKTIHKVMSVLYKVSIVFAVVFMAIAFFVPEQFMALFTEDARVASFGVDYLKIIFMGYIFFTLTNATINALRSVQTVKISIVVYGTSLLVNVFLNWVLIFGNLGAPALGIKGAAIATTIARIVEFIISTGYMMWFEKKIQFKAKALLKFDKEIFKDSIKVGGPVVGNELAWAIGSSIIAFIVAKMGTEAVAANGISSVVWQFVSVFIMGVGNAAAVIIGNTIGANEYDKAKEYGHTFIIVSIVLGAISAAVLLAIRPGVLLLYNNVSDLTKEIAMHMMGITAIIIFAQSLAIILMMGVLRGGGDTTFVLVADLIFMWLISVPLGYIGVVKLGLPIPIAYFLLRSDEIIKVVAALFRVKSGKWIKNITREVS